MDEHTDWVNQMIYMPDAKSILSCSNDTTIKIWKVPETNDDEIFTGEQNDNRRVNSFYTINVHDDYVRAMSYSKRNGRLFSVSDDGKLIINDLDAQKIVTEYDSHSNKYPIFRGQYIPVYTGNYSKIPFIKEKYTYSSTSCPTSIGASSTGNTVIVGYSDDSLILHDVRSKYSEKIRLEVGGHTDSVKSIVFSEHDGDFLCISGGSDKKLKLWDLR